MFTIGHNLSNGRKPGATNKLNIDIRQKFYGVYENMGTDDKLDGDTAFLVWARGHKKVFYSLFAKLAPTNLNIHDGRDHESFIDRMAQTMLETEAKVIESKVIDTKSQSVGIPSPSKQLSMGNDTDIVHGNGGHMGDNHIHKEVNHPIIEAELSNDVSSDELGS